MPTRQGSVSTVKIPITGSGNLLKFSKDDIILDTGVVVRTANGTALTMDLLLGTAVLMDNVNFNAAADTHDSGRSEATVRMPYHCKADVTLSLGGAVGTPAAALQADVYIVYMSLGD